MNFLAAKTNKFVAVSGLNLVFLAATDGFFNIFYYILATKWNASYESLAVRARAIETRFKFHGRSYTTVKSGTCIRTTTLFVNALEFSQFGWFLSKYLFCPIHMHYALE